MKGNFASFPAAILVLALLVTGFRFFSALADNISTSVTVSIAQCSDGLDNDGDSLTDYPADPDCTSLVDDDESAFVPPIGTPPGGGSTWYGSSGGNPPGASSTPGIGIFPTPPPQQELPAKILRLCDFNADGRCNIIDLSILLYWSEQPMPQAARYDLNNDGVIDAVDISILLYYWA